MTIQTIIANKGSLILSSDLRATVDEFKSYIGVKKIFELKDDFPAGIMINGLMDFEEIPLETLIYEFKEDMTEIEMIGKIKKEFLNFLSENTNHTPLEEYINEALVRFKNILTDSIKENGFENTITRKPTSSIPNFLRDYSNFNDEFYELIPKNYSKNEYNLKLWEIFAHFLSYEGTGIIIAGFDKNHHYPSIYVFNIYCNNGGEIIYQDIETLENIKDPIIRIFAINEEAYAFITGISEDFENYIKQYIDYSNDNFINDFEYRLRKENIENIDQIIEICEEILKNEYADFNEYVSDIKLYSINDTSELCEYLPRGLLCTFADYLIKLTALKQQISLDLETVSSESDILLLTKSNKPKWVNFNEEII